MMVETPEHDSVPTLADLAPKDPSEKQRIAAHPYASVWVDASAGTGKTKVLADRVLNLLLAGAAPERLLCLTYTRAAAAEMANRLHGLMARWATLDDVALAAALRALNPVESVTDHQLAKARKLFARVLDAPGGLRIQTIHAFCQSVLQRFPVEARMPTEFDVLDERQAHDLLENSRDGMIRALQAGVLPASVGEAFQRIATAISEDALQGVLSDIINKRDLFEQVLKAHAPQQQAGMAARDVGAAAIDSIIATLLQRHGLAADMDEQRFLEQSFSDAHIDRDGLQAAALMLQEQSPSFIKQGQILVRWLAAPLNARLQMLPDYIDIFLTKDPQDKRKKLVSKKMRDNRPDLEAVMMQEAERVLRLLEARKAYALASWTRDLLVLAQEILQGYEYRKAQQGVYDFQDMILRTKKLFHDPAVAQWVLYKLDGGLDHVLVDEAQDTNPDQWDIISDLTADFFAGLSQHADMPAPTIFAVGDRKQSIYSFQGADPDKFEVMRHMFAQRVQAGTPDDAPARRWQTVDMTTSFRTTEPVLQLVNALFDPVAGPARFGVSDGKDDITHFPWRATEPGSVELWPLLQPQDHEDEADRWIPKTTRAQVQDPEVHMAEAIAQRISQMVQHDILPSKNRPVQAGDIMVLVRSRTAFIGHLTRALKTRGIDVAGADRMVLLDQLAVQDLLAVAHVAILPEDDLTLACALKSPLLGCTEDDLYDLAVNTPGKADCLWLKLCQHAGAETRLGQAQAIVQGILGKADFMRPFDVLQYLLGPLQGRQKLLARLGLNAEDAIDELLQQALLYEDHEIPSMQGFLHWIGGSKRQIKRDQEASAAHLVRIMTVHGAKGLQAPIVFVPTTAVAPTRKRTNQDNIHWDSPKDGGKPVVMWRMDKKCESALVHKAQQETYERSIAEYNRLLYVAMTRAEDTLILSGWQKKTPQNYDESWYKHIESVFKAWQEQQEKGTMPSGMRLLPVYTEPMPEFTGLLPDDDVAVLRRFCMRKDAVPSDATPAPSAQPVSAETNDVVAPARMMPAGIRAALPAEPSPPSPLVPSRLEDEDAIAVTSPLQHSGRSSYFRGTWIHRLLQFLPDVPPSHRMAAAQKVLHGQRIAPVDAESWIHEVCAVLDMPAWQPLFGSRSVAEVSLVGLVGTFAISGQVDRLYVDDDLVWVVDYKSNRMPAATIAEVPEVYVRQLAAYRQALEKMYPHREVRCSLLWTNTLHLMTLPTEILQKVIL